MRNSSASFILASFVVVSASLGSLVTSTGCGGSGGAGGDGGGGAGGTGGGGAVECFDYSKFDGTTPAVSFKDDVLPIFQRSCGTSTSCHGDPNAPNENRPYLGPNKATTATADDITIILGGIVGVSAFYEPKMSIVAEGDPEHSFLMYKMDAELTCATLECAATKDCGVRMPQGNDTLAQDELDLVRRWIAQGAKNN